VLVGGVLTQGGVVAARLAVALGTHPTS